MVKVVVVVVMVMMMMVVVWEGSLDFPSQLPAHGPTLALESVIIVSPLPVLRRGDSPTPPLVPLSALRGVISPQTEPSTSSLYPLLGLLLPWQRAELIATLIPTEVQPALLAPHPHPGQEGREAMGVGLGSPGCTAVTLNVFSSSLTLHSWI